MFHMILDLLLKKHFLLLLLITVFFFSGFFDERLKHLFEKEIFCNIINEPPLRFFGPDLD